MPAAAAKGVGKGKDGAGGKKKKGKELLPTRIANARALRGQFQEVHHSPDGADPQPLTVPKCVECGHCGWPVYPRDSRVATRRTFERAGIQRDYGEKDKGKKSEKEGGGEGGAEGEDPLDIGEEDDDDGEGSEDSIGTVEMLETKVQDLEERVLDLESQNASLEKEAAELRQQVEDLEEALAAAEEKIELLEESEMRWREKNSVLRMENEDLRLYINRLGNRIGDLETDMCKKLKEIEWRKEAAARVERRRALMLVGLETKIRHLEGAGLVQALFKVWQGYTDKEKIRREMQEKEEMRRIQVYELKDQLSQERQHVLSLEATAERLRGSLKEAAKRMLLKVFSTTQKPWANGHALRVWCGAHPAIKLQNECDAVKADLTETREKLTASETLATQLGTDLAETKASLSKLTTEHNELSVNYNVVMEELQNVLGAQGKHAADIQQMAEERARLAREAMSKEIWAKAEKQMDEMRNEWNTEKVKLEDQIGCLEAQLESVKRGLGGVANDGNEEGRVVPKGQGILCCACLRQIVNRGVKQLPPVSVAKPTSPSKSEESCLLKEKARKLFFQQELQGMPDPDDMLHSEVWRLRKDPMVGLRYADVSPQVEWSANGKSVSMPKLTPMRIKENLKFKTVFR